MQWTEREIAIAKQLSDPETMAFLKKILIEMHTQKGEILKMNIAALDDSEYGRLMKVLYMTKEENKEKLNLITRIGKTIQSTGVTRNVAPK